MSEKQKKHKKVILASVSVIALAVLTSHFVQALSNDEIKSRQAVLEERIKENEVQVSKLAQEVNTLENAIAKLNSEIEKLRLEIELTSVKLTDVRARLDQTRNDLVQQKGILGAALRESYITGDIRTIELIVASSSFSEFFDQQEYLNRIRTTIHESAIKVAELEKALEEQEEEQRLLLEQLVGQQISLRGRVEEKNRLLSQTKGQQTLYKQKVAQDKKAYDRLQLILAARQRVLSSGTGNYPFAETQCSPPYDKDYPPPVLEDELVYPCPDDGWGYIIRQCTSWAYWRRTDLGMDAGGYWGSAREWKKNAESQNYQVNQKPKKGAIGMVYLDGSPLNHVYIVEDVLPSGEIIASQYNSYEANKAWGMYSLVEKTPKQYQGDWFIHNKVAEQ